MYLPTWSSCNSYYYKHVSDRFVLLTSFPRSNCKGSYAAIWVRHIGRHALFRAIAYLVYSKPWFGACVRATYQLGIDTSSRIRGGRFAPAPLPFA